MAPGYRVVSPAKPECPGEEGEPVLDRVRWRSLQSSRVGAG